VSSRKRWVSKRNPKSQIPNPKRGTRGNSGNSWELKRVWCVGRREFKQGMTGLKKVMDKKMMEIGEGRGGYRWWVAGNVWFWRFFVKKFGHFGFMLSW
jgi:hypothetical protein